jgi:hypothetical protein
VICGHYNEVDSRLHLTEAQLATEGRASRSHLGLQSSSFLHLMESKPEPGQKNQLSLLGEPTVAA